MTTTESAVRDIRDEVLSALAAAHPYTDWPDLLAQPGRSTPQEAVDMLVGLGYDRDEVQHSLLQAGG